MAADLRKMSPKAVKWIIQNLERSLNKAVLESPKMLDVTNIKVISKSRVGADVIIGTAGSKQARRYEGCVYEYQGNTLVKISQGSKDINSGTNGKDPDNGWLHGIEHLTKDLNGYVYWRTMPVERFDFGDDAAGAAREKFEAERLAGICMWLEEKGMEVNLSNIMNEQKAGMMYEDLASGFGCARRAG